MDIENKNYFKQILELKQMLEEDIAGCDIKWTLFVTAAQSYRFGSRLSPCPSKYLKQNEINIDTILEIISKVTSFGNILEYIINKDYAMLDVDVIELIHWVILRPPNLCLETIKEEQVPTQILFPLI